MQNNLWAHGGHGGLFRCNSLHGEWPRAMSDEMIVTTQVGELTFIGNLIGSLLYGEGLRPDDSQEAVIEAQADLLS